MVAGLEPLTRVAAIVPGLFINVLQHGAVGDGVTDDRTAIQAADTAAAAIGAALYFPGRVNGYLVTGSVRPSSGVTWFGDGYRSQIKCPDDGWLLVAVTNMGIVNVDNKTNVRITNLRIRGTKIAPIDVPNDGGFPRSAHTPKLIYMEGTSGSNVAERVQVDHCWLENSVWEGIWQGGTIANSIYFDISHNHFFDIEGSPTLTLNAEKLVVSSNTFKDCDVAIGVTGRYITITTNMVFNATAEGIGVGEIGNSGLVVVAGNFIHIRPTGSVAWQGILVIGATTNGLINIGPNIIVYDPSGGGTGGGACIKVSAGGDVDIHNNSIQGSSQLYGIAVEASIDTDISLRANTMKLLNESATANQSRGIIATNSAGAFIIRSQNNKVIGMTRANGNYAYDYRTGGGTFNARMAGDMKTEGNMNIGGKIYQTAEFDNIPLFISSDNTSTAALFEHAQIGMLKFRPVHNLTIASGAISIAGISGSTGLPNRQTRIAIDTEGAAASDDLDSVNGAQDGDIIILQTVDSGRDVTVKHNTGNILCTSDFTLSSTSDRIVLLYDGGLSKWIELSRWSPTLNVATSYQVAGTKVVGARETGWTAGTGTANKAAFATYAGQDVSATYTEAEIQAIDDAVKANSQRIKAIEDCLRTHGLIN